MELFDNYQDSKGYFCDITPETNYLDPIARLICGEWGIGIGTFGCPDLYLYNGLWSCNDQLLWNCSLCGNDQPFWIPFTDGDTFDFQFQQLYTDITCDHAFYPENLITGGQTSAVSYEIHLCCDDTIFEVTEAMHQSIVQQQYVGSYITNDLSNTTIYNPIQMVRINLEAIKDYLMLADIEPCFYILFRFPKDNDCLPSGSTLDIYTEPFKYRKCDVFPYIYNIESKYTYKDCYGSYYGNLFSEGIGIPFVYSNRVRVPGSFEQQSFSISKEKIETSLKTTSSQICENWLLRTTHLPKGFAKFVVAILGGKDVLIDGTEYQVEGELARNNETGNQFYLEIPAQNCDCNKSLSCT
jgi:hypothetical protein